MESEKDHAATRGLLVGEAFLKALALYCAAHARDIEKRRPRPSDSPAEAADDATPSRSADTLLGEPEE